MLLTPLLVLPPPPPQVINNNDRSLSGFIQKRFLNQIDSYLLTPFLLLIWDENHYLASTTESTEEEYFDWKGYSYVHFVWLTSYIFMAT